MHPSLEKYPLVQAAATSVLRSPEPLHMGNPKPETQCVPPALCEKSQRWCCWDAQLINSLALGS